MLLLLTLALLAGALTILAPCVWPLLPVLLSSETGNSGKRRPLGLVTGVSLAFGVLTLSASYLEKTLGIKEQYIRDISVIILIGMGLVLLIPALTTSFESKVSAWVGKYAPKPNPNSNGFKGGFIVGVSLGFLWTPCTGPIFASITSSAATSKINSEIFLVTLFYLIGVSVPLYFFVLGGKKVLSRIKAFNKHLGKVQIVSALILISYGVLTFTGYDKSFEVYLINKLPSYTNFLTGFEKTAAVKKELNKITNHSSTVTTDSKLFNVSAGVRAPEIVGDHSWINSQPLTIASLKGKVVLVDFWTYSCINCIRSLKYVTKWYNTYHNQGFVVIGVHSPEFPFEKDRNNVIDATKRFGIKYPVVQDNELATWNNYNNNYWPAEYLIDAQGNIRREEFGEGQYNEMEGAIQALLKANGQAVSAKIDNKMNVDFSHQTSLETYLGTYRADQTQNPYQNISNGIRNYVPKKAIDVNTYQLGGRWGIDTYQITAFPNSVLAYNFIAHQVYIILKPGSPNSANKVKVYFNNQLLTGANAGSDVKDGVITLDSTRLYNIFDSKGQLTNGVIKLVFQQANTQAFTFTFG